MAAGRTFAIALGLAAVTTLPKAFAAEPVHYVVTVRNVEDQLADIKGTIDAANYGVLAGVLGGLAVLLWWLFFSRAPWLERAAADPGWGFAGSPLVVGDLVMVVASGHLIAYDLASGHPRARFKAIEGKTWNHPVLTGDILLVRNGEEMVAFRLAVAGS